MPSEAPHLQIAIPLLSVTVKLSIFEVFKSVSTEVLRFITLKIDILHSAL